jgi:ankyrin repeat protein
VVALLVEHGADVNARIEPYHDTVLHAAARAGGSIRTLRLLVQKGAKVNAEDDRGVTPLVCAGSSGWDEGVEFLLANGAVDTWGWRDVLLHSQSLTKRDQQTPARAQ